MSEMGGIEPADGSEERRTKRLRLAADIGIAAQTLIYLFLYVYINRHANPMGDGMEWVAVVPGTFIFAVGIIPTLALRLNRRLLTAAVLVAFVGVAIDAAFLLEIVREMKHWD
jgi:hypothetical protein